MSTPHTTQDRTLNSTKDNTVGTTPSSSYSTANTIATVAGREISVLLRSKSIIFSLIITLLVTVGGVFVANHFMGKDDGNQSSLAVVGMDAEPFVQINKAFTESNNPGAMEGAGPIGGVGFGGTGELKVETLNSADEARQKVKDGDFDAALVATGEGMEATYELLADGTPNATISAIVSAALGANAQNEALNAVGVDPAEFASAMPSTSFTTVDLGEEKDQEANIGAVVTIMIGVSLMSFFIILFAANIGGRVTEEKSSRVVEIILASVRPLDFLAGKLVGNALIGLLSTAVIIGAGALAVKFTGLLDDFQLDLSVLPLILLSFIIGLLFFGSLYAAAGAMVSRTEDLQSTQSPIMLFIFGMIYAPIFGWSALDSTIMQVLAWVPPFSLTVAPVQMAGGNMSLLEVLGAYGLALLATLVVLSVVAKIYRNAILHNGAKLTWVKALKGS